MSWTMGQLQSVFGFHPMKNAEYFVEGWNKIGGKYEKIDRCVIIDDELYDSITEEYKSKLGKRFFTYTCSCVFCKRSVWEENRRKEEEREQEKQKQLEKQNEQEKQCDEAGYVSYQWIRDNVGEYYNEVPDIRYYWTIIGDRFKKANWKGDIEIEDAAEKDVINAEVKFDIKGNTFLNRRFKVNGYSHDIIGTYKIVDQNRQCGVYGIYQDGELVYIGKTMRSFQERWQEHKDVISGKAAKPQGMKVYNYLKENAEFKILLDINHANYEGKFTERDLEVAEFTLIQTLKPKGNIVGISKPYIFEN